MSSKHFNEEFESNLGDDRNVLHVHEQGISVQFSLRNTMISVASFNCSFNSKEVKHEYPTSSLDTRPENKNQIGLTSLQSVKQLC